MRTTKTSTARRDAPTAKEQGAANQITDAARRRISYIENIGPMRAEVDPDEFADMCDFMERTGLFGVDPETFFSKTRPDFLLIVRAVLAWGTPEQLKADTDTLSERIKMAERLRGLIPFPALQRRLKVEVLDILRAEKMNRGAAVRNLQPCPECGWIHGDEFKFMTHPQTREHHVIKNEHARHYIKKLHDALACGEPGRMNADLWEERHPHGEPRDIYGDWRGNEKAYNALIVRTVNGMKGLVCLKRPA